MATKLFVGSLSWNVTDDMLRDFFAAAGTVTSASVVTDRETNRSRGFGFVEMSSEDEAKAAVDQLNGKELDGRAVTVSEARERSERPRTGGSSSFGGGGFGGPRPGGGGFGGPRFDQSGPSPSRARNFGPDAKPSKGPGSKKVKKDAERVRGPIPTKFTGRSFSLDDDKDAVIDDVVPDIDDFATSQPEDKKVVDDDGGDE